MERRITQRELRNSSGDIMRALDQGQSFVVTRNGVPVGELHPARARRFVATDAVVAAFTSAPALDFACARMWTRCSTRIAHRVPERRAAEP